MEGEWNSSNGGVQILLARREGWSRGRIDGREKVGRMCAGSEESE
jgi:hypothetical protein